MLSKGTELPRPPPTHPEETEEELTETNDMQEDEVGTGLHRCSISVIIKLWSDHVFMYTELCNIFVHYFDKSDFRKMAQMTAHTPLRDLVYPQRERKNMFI